MAVIVPNCPTSPEVPMPAPVGMFSMRNTAADSEPTIALAIIGGIQMRGFFIIFGSCSIDVPNPWDNRPFNLFSRYELTAKPIIFAAQPATAAPIRAGSKFVAHKHCHGHSGNQRNRRCNDNINLGFLRNQLAQLHSD